MSHPALRSTIEITPRSGRIRRLLLTNPAGQQSSARIIGRNTVIDTDLYSTCCAVQNLWLAARVEGIGVGWVSILDYDELRPILGIPATVVPVAYLCIGYPREFLDEPELQRRGWATRLPLDQVVYQERWGSPIRESPGAV